jgi:hypothetical protein
MIIWSKRIFKSQVIGDNTLVLQTTELEDLIKAHTLTPSVMTSSDKLGELTTSVQIELTNPIWES